MSPYQPRDDFDKDHLNELAASILEVGLIQPPTVRSTKDVDRYELIAGERRLRACQIAGLEEIPVYVKERSDKQSAQAALIENVQRKDLNPFEIAQALQSLMDSHGLNQQSLAERIGKQRSTVANYLRLLSLPGNIRDSLKADKISMGHAKAILSLTDGHKQQLLHERVLRDQLTVRQAEEKANQLMHKVSAKHLRPESRNYEMEAVIESLEKAVGSKATITTTAKEKGQVIIDYYSWDDLNRLLSLLGVKHD